MGLWRGSRESWRRTCPTTSPCAARASFKHIYVADSANRRVVRVDPVYAAEAMCAIK